MGDGLTMLGLVCTLSLISPHAFQLIACVLVVLTVSVAWRRSRHH